MINNSQSSIDTQIQTINKAICRHFDGLENSTRGMVSQDILAQLRTFTEHIMLKFYSNGTDIENSYPNICNAIDYVKTRGNLKSLKKFHDYLQIVASHYTLDEENSERLMLKYYEYLLKIKKLVYDNYNMTILENIDKFPLNIDTNMSEYYSKIAIKLNKHVTKKVESSENFYIHKVKPFFVDQKIYYEVTFAPATDKASKLNRIIAFTNIDITSNYAAKFSFDHDQIEIHGKSMPIIIIVGWEVWIRTCEYKNFSKLVTGVSKKIGYVEQRLLSNYLTATGMTFNDIVNFKDHEFQQLMEYVAAKVTEKSQRVIFLKDLEHGRKIIKSKLNGSNLLSYLLFNMNNKIIKNQFNNSSNSNLSQLFVQNKCIPFDSMPFIYSPVGHNPRLSDLFNCIDATDRQHELLARMIRNNTEINGKLFTPINEVSGFENLDTLVNRYNNKLWRYHREESKLVVELNHVYINGYKNDTRYIIDYLALLSTNGIQNYSNSMISWLNESSHVVDCDEKKETLVKMFENAMVALVYGSAGTGKTTLINHLSHFLSERNKLYLAQTNPAVDNLRRRVTASNSYFCTIAKFLSSRSMNVNYDLLIIDESSTVSNRDMKAILNKARFKMLLLVGDTYQINSIKFGNWFSLAKEFISSDTVYELTEPYRTTNKGLLTLWDRVRKMDDTILESIARNDYSTLLNDSIFEAAEEDEIILCLNYDGLYGINNINRFLQEGNPSQAVQWGIQNYKINDPILFNESERFSPVIYNNMKGKIIDIEVVHNQLMMPERIKFDVEIEKVINGLDAMEMDFELLNTSPNGNSVIRFFVEGQSSDDDDDDDDTSNSIIPFQVAYAVSIHKSQGLEYDSVKIVITDEVDELISHNIFYTAITRARKKLKIFWSPEVENSVLSKIKPMNHKKDIQLLKNGIS